MAIGAYIKYGGICSKVKAMYAKRLHKQNYIDLLSKSSVADVASYLKHTSYSYVFDMRDERTLHREELETLLKQSLQKDLTKLKHFAGQEEKGLLDTYFSKSELQYILTVIRYLGNQAIRDKSSIVAALANTSNYSTGVMELIQANNFEEFLLLLKKTPYADVFYGMDFSQMDYATIETILSARFYTILLSASEKYLSNTDCVMLKRQIGTTIDMKNISCIIRLKKYFPNVEIRKYLLPFGKILKQDKLQELLQSSNIYETLHELSPIYYNYFSKDQSDYHENRLLYDFDKSVMLSAQPSISVVLAYLSLKEIEIKNIIHIIEGIRYQNYADDIRKRLIGIE